MRRNEAEEFRNRLDHFRDSRSQSASLSRSPSRSPSRERRSERRSSAERRKSLERRIDIERRNAERRGNDRQSRERGSSERSRSRDESRERSRKRSGERRGRDWRSSDSEDDLRDRRWRPSGDDRWTHDLFDLRDQRRSPRYDRYDRRDRYERSGSRKYDRDSSRECYPRYSRGRSRGRSFDRSRNDSGERYSRDHYSGRERYRGGRDRSEHRHRSRDNRVYGSREQRTVFAKQLAVNLDPRDLEEFMHQAGDVLRVSILKDRSGRSKGMAYVEFSNPNVVKRAIALTDKKLLGIPIIVEHTEAEKSRLAQIEARNKLAEECGVTGNVHSRIYIANVFPGLEEKELRQLFELYGEITGFALPKDGTRPKGYAFIQYGDVRDASRAYTKLQGVQVRNRSLKLLLGESTGDNVGGTTFKGSAFKEEKEKPAPGQKRSADLGDGDTSNVSFNKISRTSLMKKLMREDENLGGEPQGPVHQAKAPKPSFTTPTRCLLLTNMFNPEEETGNWVQELEEDVKEECEEKYGPVSHIAVERNSPGEIYVKFSRVEDAEKAAKDLNGRFFGGKTVSVEWVVEAVYNARFPKARDL